jgi:integrase
MSGPYRPFCEVRVRSTIPGTISAPIILTTEQATALTKVKDTKRRVRYLVGLTAGLRESELAGLKWIDVDLTKKTLKVERQLVRGKGAPKTKPPKKSSYRTGWLPESSGGRVGSVGVLSVIVVP